MADVFDEITAPQPAGDIFDHVANSGGDIFDQVAADKPLTEKVMNAAKSGAEAVGQGARAAFWQLPASVNKFIGLGAFPATREAFVTPAENKAQEAHQEFGQSVEGAPFWERVGKSAAFGVGQLATLPADIAMGAGMKAAGAGAKVLEAVPSFALGMGVRKAGDEGVMGFPQGVAEGLAMHSVGGLGQGLSVVPRVAAQAAGQGALSAGMTTVDTLAKEGHLPTGGQVAESAATGAAMGVPFGLAPGKMGVERPKDSGVRIDTRPGGDVFDSLHGVADAADGGRPKSSAPEFIQRAATLVGEDPGYLVRTMQAESGGQNVRARQNGPAATTATGLFQFTDGTWRAMVNQYGRDYGLTLDGRGNADQQATAAALFTRDNRSFLRNALGREPSDGDLYMAAFLGRGGAEKFLAGLAENPNDQAISHVAPSAGRANQSIFLAKDGRSRTLQEVYDLMAAKVQPKDGETSARTDMPAPAGLPGPETPAAPESWPLRPELDALRQDMETRAPGIVEGQDSPWDTRLPVDRINDGLGLDAPLARRSELESLRQDIQGRDVASRAADEMGAPVPATAAARINERPALPEGQGFDLVPDVMRQDRLPAKLEDAPTMPAQDIRFHLNERPAEAFQGIRPEDVAHGIKGYTEAAPGAAPVRIVRTMDELPTHILDQYRRSGETGAIEGAYDRGSRAVWLVADNLESKSRAGEIWLHENVAHHGLRAVFGSDKAFDGFLKRSAQFYGYGSDHIAMEEHIARLAEKMNVGQALTPKERSLWGKFVDYVRGWLVKNGWATPKDADLHNLLRDSLTRMARGGEKPGEAGSLFPAQSVAFSAKEDPRQFRSFLEGEPVARLRGDEIPRFQKLGQLAQAIGDWWANKYGGKVENPELGDVVIDKRAANYSAGHGMSPEKQAAFAAVPDIIQRGKVLSSEEKIPGSGLIGHVIGAPIEIGGKSYVGLALVREDVNKRRFYVHDVYLTEKLQHSQSGLLPKERPTESNAGAFKRILSRIFDPGKPGGGDARFSQGQSQGDYQRDRIAFDGNDRASLSERVKDAGREAYRRGVSKDQPLVDLARRGDSVAANDVENRVRRLRGLGGIVEEMLAGKGALRYGVDGQETAYVPGTKSLKDVLAPLKTEAQYRDYESLRAAEREKALAIHRPDVRGNDRGRAEFEVARLERKYGPEGMAELRAVSAEHRQFERDAVLTPLHESGWISKEGYDAILKAPESEYYASFSREMDDVDHATVGSRDVVKKIKGSDRRVLPSTEATIANVARAVKLVETLKLHQSIVALRDLTPDLAEAITPYRKPGMPPRDALVTAENGRKSYWTVPPDVAKALDYFNPREVNIIVKALALPAKMLRAGATLGLEFIARNPMRDQISAFVFSKYGYNPATDFVRGVIHTVKGEMGGGSDWYSEWRAAGGAESFFTSLDRDAVKVTTKDLVAYRTGRDTLGKIVRNPLDALRAMSEFMEKGTRVGAFIKAREKGATPLDAMAESRDLTLDFSRMGADTKALNQVVAFWNANVQGVDKMARALKDRPGQTLLRAGLGITLPSVVLALHNQGQQWYEELPAWQKDYFWCVKVGDTILRIPKPFELGILFGSLPERIVDFAYKQDPQGLKDVGRAALDALTPGWMPTAGLPLVESMTNYSFFRGKPLESQAVQSLPPGMRFGTNTPEIAKRIGQLADISPIKLENWFRAWTGSMGKMALDASDLALRDSSIPPVAKTSADVPLVRGFVAREPIGSGSESVDRFYKNMEETTQASQGRKALLEAGDTAGAARYDRNAYFAPAAKALSAKMADMRAEIAGIQEAQNISPEEKRTRIDVINRGMTTAAREFDEAYRTGNITPEILYLGERSRVHEALDQYKELVKSGRTQEAQALVKSAGLETKAGLVKWADAVMALARELRTEAEDPRLSGAQRATRLTRADKLTQTALAEFQKRMGGAR